MARYRMENANSVGSYGSGQGIEFQADTQPHALAAVQAIATVLQAKMVLVDFNTIVTGGSFTWTAVTPAASGAALGNAPTGISW